MTSWTEIMTSWTLFQNTFSLRRPRVANFADIIKIATRFIKTTLKVSKTELETLYKKAIYIC